MYYTPLLYFLQIYLMFYLPFELWIDLQIADLWGLKYFRCRSQTESGFLFREHFYLYQMQESKKMFCYFQTQQSSFSVSWVLKVPPEKTAVLVDRYRKAFAMTSMYSMKGSFTVLFYLGLTV